VETLLLRSLGLLALFQLLGWTVIAAGRRRRSGFAAALLLAALAGAAGMQRRTDPALTLGSAVVAAFVVERAVRRGRGPWQTALVGLVPVVLAATLDVTGTDPRRSWSEMQHELDRLAGADSLGAVPSPTAPPEERVRLERTQALAVTASHWALRLLPAEIVVFALLQVLVLVVVAGRAVRAAGVPVAVLPVASWRVPFASIWALALGLALAATRHPVPVAAGLNLVVVVAALLALQGMAVVLAWFGRTARTPGRTWMVAVVAFSALVAWPFVPAALALLGAADLWVDFRRPRRAADDP
jgi:hypothetical protein